MIVEIDTKQVAEVQREVQSIYQSLFSQDADFFVGQAFTWADDCFTGKHHDYQSIDARYHDLEHTLQVTLCMMRLLRGRHLAQAQPPLTRRMFELGLLAILLHDTGYLKKRGDNDGSGAKYTWVHVERSMEFAAELLREKKFSAEEIKAVQNMIRCTGVNVNLEAIPFQSDPERITGFALGTGDLLGQMAATDYIEKLPTLYAEFAEAARYDSAKTRACGTFTSIEDLLQKTPAFWEMFVQPKIKISFQGLYQFLNEPYPNGTNWYITRIEENMARLRQKLEKSASK